MCMVIDACTFAPVFDSACQDHAEFRPVLEWIVSGKGKVIYGGSRYKSELSKAHKYIRFFTQLERAGKLVRIDDAKVDAFEESLSKQFKDPHFNDSHIVAIVIVSRCLVVCTNDRRAIPFLKLSKLYPKDIRPPRIYGSSKNRVLLTDKYIADICRPAKCGTRDLRRDFGL